MATIRPDGSVLLSPSDLTTAAQCEFGWLRGIDLRLGRITAEVPEDALLEQIAQLGDAHEQRELDRLSREREVTTIRPSRGYRSADLQRAAVWRAHCATVRRSSRKQYCATTASSASPTSWCEIPPARTRSGMPSSPARRESPRCCR